MNSSLHDGLAQALTTDGVGFALLVSRCLGLALPMAGGVVARETQLSTVDPTSYWPDGVIEVGAGDDRVALIPEIQLRTDPRKRDSWPVYATHVRARLRCDALVIVVTMSETVAEWAREPVAFGGGLGSFQPHVLSPSAVPPVVDWAEAVANPTLALLSALIHAAGPPDVAIAVAGAAANAALVSVDREAGRLYFDLIHAQLPAALQRALEERMMHGKYEYQSEFARRFVAEGRAEGKAEGRAEGRAEGKAASIFEVLTLRGLPISETLRQRIAGCRDDAELDRWLVTAVTARSVADLGNG